MTGKNLSTVLAQLHERNVSFSNHVHFGSSLDLYRRILINLLVVYTLQLRVDGGLVTEGQIHQPTVRNAELSLQEPQHLRFFLVLD